MKIDLKDFQEDAVRFLLKEVGYARREARDGRAQAIILNSPTGSGKTVTITALLERIWQGDEDASPDTEAVFLWLSDSPELNSQSRDKVLGQSSVFRDHELIVLEPPFSQERFDPGKIYFLNTQKLGKDNLLTKSGDGRDYTIWQTIENTAQSKPDHFYLIIDEAHRGMNLSARQEQQAHTIVQKFIFGDAAVGLSPVKTIIGISATPERFAKVIEGAARTKREHSVPAAAVRESGLLKERIVLYCPEQDQPTDWTLLTESVKRWKRFSKDWRDYCKSQGMTSVDPVLVVQVEDSVGEKPTRTDMDKVVEILEREAGHLGAGAMAHCFEIDSPIQAGGHQIRKIEPSKIEQDSVVRVVFFKMALSTGWDCPRAEVMMSFRRARDYTFIAQLVGRMVRAPMARRIEGSELLNTVSLYLPHYDRGGLKAIVEKLNDPENASPAEVVEGASLVTLIKAPGSDDLFKKLSSLPSYVIDRAPKTSNTRRLIKLARQLTMDEIEAKAWGEAKSLIVKTLSGELDRLKNDENYKKLIKTNQEISVREVSVEAGEWKEPGGDKLIRVITTPENIDDLFEICGRMLGEGLHKEYWKEHWDRQDPQRAKLELFGILQDKDAWAKIESTARKKIDELFADHNEKILELITSKQEEYNRIKRKAKEPEPTHLMFPDSIDLPRKEPPWEQHLYVDENGRFGWDANTWEDAVLKTELKNKEVVGWLRNESRKPWSLSVPYRHRGEDRPLYPDLLIFRRVGNKLKLDLLDPHWPGLGDAAEKAAGLARYADKHGEHYGRIEIISLTPKGKILRLDVNQEATREKVKVVKDLAHLEALFQGQI